VEEYADPDREEYRGLGLYMIHKFMDRVDVQTAPGKGTTVEMTKILR
jgi:anti-sigma regulatory factor (Ser/Thr protein kinase)